MNRSCRFFIVSIGFRVSASIPRLIYYYLEATQTARESFQVAFFCAPCPRPYPQIPFSVEIFVQCSIFSALKEIRPPGPPDPHASYAR
jgi:hypothetical protein